MNLPPFLTGLGLLFWGHQTGIWYPALVLAAVLEFARFTKWRLDFSDVDYSRFWDLCNILFAASAFYCFINRDGNNTLMSVFQTSLFTAGPGGPAPQVFFIFFQWWPMVFFPMAAAQAFGLRDKIPANVFVWLLRSRPQAGQKEPGPELSVNIGYCYLGICLLSAGAANRRDFWFYAGLCLIAGISLWSMQPRRFRNVVWIAVFLLVVKLGFWGHVAHSVSQAAMENAVSAFVARYAGRSVDPNEAHTAIGRLGRLKLSDRIVLTIEGDGRLPSLIRDSSYTVFKSPSWTLTNRDFNAVTQDIDIATWNLLPVRGIHPTVVISGSFSRLGGLLPIPHGTMQLENLPDANLTTNRYGAIRSTGGTDFFSFRARYNSRGATIDSPPDDADQDVPKLELPAIERIASRLQLNNRTEAEAIAAVTEFLGQFRYTLYQTKGAWRRNSATPEVTPLARFLEETRAGHCEHFATATVLLLRQAGIPARYTTGFAVFRPERGSTQRFFVRERDAHAWCLYYSDAEKRWKELDTTPANWFDQELDVGSALQPINDYFTRLWFRFNRWRQSEIKTNWQYYALGMAGVLTAFLVFRLLRNKRRTRRADDRGPTEKLLWPGADSEFFRIEQHLKTLGLERSPGETPAAWLQRIARAPAVAYGDLQPILDLHYRYRFDPRGLDAREREELRAAVQRWLQARPVAAGVVADPRTG